MKHLRYKGDSHVRSFDSDTLKRIEVDEEELSFDCRKGGVLEMKNASAEKLLELYPNDFEEVDSDTAEQLQLDTFTPATVGNDPNPAAEAPAPTTPAGATGTNRTRSSTKTG